MFFDMYTFVLNYCSSSNFYSYMVTLIVVLDTVFV